jgi:hypothetical protein
MDADLQERARVSPSWELDHPVLRGAHAVPDDSRETLTTDAKTGKRIVLPTTWIGRLQTILVIGGDGTIELIADIAKVDLAAP